VRTFAQWLSNVNEVTGLFHLPGVTLRDFRMETLAHAATAAALAALSGRTINHIFLVACGGSLSIMMPGKYFLDRHSRSLSSDAYNADEFVNRNPARLGPNALVIVCSQTGMTLETLRAARHAKSQGAVTIGMTLDLASPLAAAVDFPLAYRASYTTGVPIDAADSNYAVLYALLAAILKQCDHIDLATPLFTSLANLQGVIDKAHLRLASTFATYAPRYKNASAIYTLACGPVYGAAYSFSTCVLMEMQWYDSQAIHADEFFHGPFEVVDKSSCFVAMLGIDETRPLAERARDFLLKFGTPQNILVVDAKDLDLSGLDERLAGYLVPLVFFDTLWRFAYHLAELRQHPMLEGRRYMKKITGY
jgi:fructoselysine 6-phosphate deglycase